MKSRPSSDVSMKRRAILAGVVAVGFLFATLASPVAAKPKNDASPVQLVAKIQWGSDPASVAADLDAIIVDTLIGSRRVVLLEVTDKDQKKAAKRVSADRRVLWAEPNFVGTAPEGNGFHAWPSETFPTPSNARDRQSQRVVTDLDLRGAHGSTTGRGVQVAVLDTGVDASHPALRGSVRRRLDVVDGDFLPDDVGNGLDDDGDGHVDEAVGHGTHVAGIILLAAPDATVMAYRVLDSDGTGTVFGVAEAIRHAVDDGADVINLSFGTSTKIESEVLKASLSYAKRSGVMVVAAAGNDGSGKKRYPAASNDIVAVGAYDESTGAMARFASHGKWVSVLAPGVRIVSTIPGDRYASWSGSSMAAPFVSAEAALLLELDPDASLKDLVKLIESNTFKVKGKHGAHGRVDLVGATGDAAK